MTSVTTADTISSAIIHALDGNTVVGTNIFSPRSWPVPLGDLPILLLQSPRETKVSAGPNSPAFNVLATFRIIGRLTFKAAVDDAGAAAALAALATLQRQIEVAVINDWALFKLISEIKSIETVNEVKSEGNQPIAELTMDLACEFYQAFNAFAQPATTPIEEFAIYADLLNVFSPDGTYAPPFPYDVTASPRTTGPDGRVEGGALVEIDQGS